MLIHWLAPPTEYQCPGRSRCPLVARRGHPARVYRTSGVGPKADVGAPPLTQLSLENRTWPGRAAGRPAMVPHRGARLPLRTREAFRPPPMHTWGDSGTPVRVPLIHPMPSADRLIPRVADHDP